MRILVWMIGLFDVVLASPSLSFVFQNIGIYSECQHQGNRSEFSKTSTLLMTHKMDDWHKDYGFDIFLRTYNFDVCFDEKRLLDVFERLMLHKEHFRLEPNKTYSTSVIGAILTYLPEPMTNLLKSLVHEHTNLRCQHERNA